MIFDKKTKQEECLRIRVHKIKKLVRCAQKIKQTFRNSTKMSK